MAFPVEGKYILIAENDLGVEFPASYKEKLNKVNGGELETEEDVWTFYPVFDDSDRKRISRTANHLIKENKSAKEWNGFPANGLAIADNGSGDFLLYLIEENNGILDPVYLWLHETKEVEKIADSIAELFE